MAQRSETIEIEAHSPEEVEHSLMAPDVSMMLLSWVTFFLLLGILYKSAWKPILAGLDKREQTIRESLDEAERIKNELARIHQTRDEILKTAEEKSKQVLEQSRKAALESAKHIEQRAQEEAQIALENARREIREETAHAQAILRQESIHLAVELAGKLIQENLDTGKNRKLAEELIAKI